MTFEELVLALGLGPEQALMLNHWLADRVVPLGVMEVYGNSAVDEPLRMQGLYRRFRSVAAGKLARHLSDYLDIEGREENGRLELRAQVRIYSPIGSAALKARPF